MKKHYLLNYSNVYWNHKNELIVLEEIPDFLRFLLTINNTQSLIETKKVLSAFNEFVQLNVTMSEIVDLIEKIKKTSKIKLFKVNDNDLLEIDFVPVVAIKSKLNFVMINRLKLLKSTVARFI